MMQSRIIRLDIYVLLPVVYYYRYCTYSSIMVGACPPVAAGSISTQHLQ